MLQLNKLMIQYNKFYYIYFTHSPPDNQDPLVVIYFCDLVICSTTADSLFLAYSISCL